MVQSLIVIVVLLATFALSLVIAFVAIAVPIICLDWIASRARHYSLHELLALMTVVAVVLGMIAAAM